MTSTLKLYYSTGISIRKNFIIDSISEYLATKTATTVLDFQYIKNRLFVSIKVKMDQANLDYTTANDIDYASIQNGTEKIVYYHVTDKKWLAQDTLELSLSMDTINTFSYNVDYSVSNRTRINRQHKDRFQYRWIYDIESETVNPSTFDSGVAGTPPTYYIFKDKLDPIPSPLPAMQFGLNVVKGGDTIPATLSIYLYNTDTKILTLYRKVNATEDAAIDFAADSSGYIYVNIDGDIFYPPSGQHFVIKTPLDDIPTIGGYTASNSNTNGGALFAGTLSAGKRWFRKIDLMSEGLSPLLYGKDKGEIEGDSRDWYLVYKGNNPLRCYLCSDTGFDIGIGTTQEIQPSDLTAGTYYYILPDRNGNYLPMEINEGNNVSASISDWYNNGSWREQYVTVYWLDGSSIKVRRYYYRDYGLGFFYVSTLTTYTTNKIKFITNRLAVYYNEANQLTSNTGKIRQFTSGTFSLTPSTNTVRAFSALDRTDSTLVKIIKLPYRPADDVFTGWQYSDTEHMLYKMNLETPLERNIAVDFNPFSILSFNETPSITALRNANYESKLLHSDYYQPKCVYDSFSKIFALERVNIDRYLEFNEFWFTFNVTNTINSRFLFTFTSYIVDDKMEEDYPNILYIARNNEAVIYNSEYINYIKTGYNYDVKSKTRQEVGNWLGFGLSTVGAIVSFAASGATGGVSAAAGVGLSISAMSQLVNAVNTTAQAEANQAQRLLQLRNQRESVYGADDVDLMSLYTNNKAKMMVYEVSDRMKNLLFDLFFYTGYAEGINGIPNVKTRTRFNFVSADLEFSGSKNLPSEVVVDIQEKFAAGVTFIHKYNGAWDINQTYENWETSLFN